MPSQETVLVTGCSDGGIGSALAMTFQSRGFHVFATARDPTKMTDLKDLPNVTRLTLDVTKPADITAAADAVLRRTGGTLNYLVNNAARTHVMPVLDENIEKAKSVFDTNVWGTIAITQAFAPFVIKAKGSIVFIASIQGYVNAPFKATYAASKKATEIFADTLRLEMKPFDVSVMSILTGMVLSNCHSYFDDFRLPDKSLYKQIEGKIGDYARGRDGMPTMDYAAHVVGKITDRTTAKYWYGPLAHHVKERMAPPVSHENTDPELISGTGLDIWIQ